MKKLLLCIALVSPLIADDAPPVKGTLCFVAPKQSPTCTATERTLIKIVPADTERQFVWSSSDGKTITAGVIAAKGDQINVADTALREVSLSVRGDRPHGWPSDLRLKIADANKKEWQWTVPGKTVQALSQLRLLPGRYTIAFSAEHHLTQIRRADLAKNIALREVTLRPIPAVYGRVIGSDDKPLANAQVFRADRKLIATADEQGSFRGEVGDPPPDSILVEKAGFGSRLIPLQPTDTADSDLGTIRLGKPLKLTLRFSRPTDLEDVVRVSLQRDNEFKYELTPIASEELAAADEVVVFEDLSKGKYSVVVEGKNAFEKMNASVELDDADAEKEIKIEPFRLEGTARIGEDPISGTIALTSRLENMRMTLPIENGRFAATLWQHGQAFGAVKSNASNVPEMVKSPELGADPSVWNIQFKKRFITGRIYDAETQQPVYPADITLQVSYGDGPKAERFYTTVKALQDGSFAIMATRAGVYELKVNVPEYVADKQTVEVREEDGSLQRDFALSHGVPAIIEVVWSSGAPVVNAFVSEGVASDGHNPERMYRLDPSGHVSLRVRRGETRTIYIVPAEGSFAIAHVAAQGQDAKPIRVVVPPPTGSLRVHLVDTDGKPARALVGMRFNGEVVPYPVIGRLPRPPGFQTGVVQMLQLPAGAYEIWPMSPPSYAPIGAAKSVGVATGETEVELVARP